MKTMTMAGGILMALMLCGSGAEAQRAPGDGGVLRRGPEAPIPRVHGPMALQRRVQITLDRAEILELAPEQREALRRLSDDISTASEGLRDRIQARREGRREAMQRRLRERDPLPADADLRAAALAERRAERRVLAEELRLEAREIRERVAEVMDPLIQRYEQVVPPSQRPAWDGGRAQRRDGVHRDRGRPGRDGALRERVRLRAPRGGPWRGRGAPPHGR